MVEIAYRIGRTHYALLGIAHWVSYGVPRMECLALPKLKGDGSMPHTMEDIVHAYPKEDGLTRYVVVTDHTYSRLDWHNEIIPFVEAGIKHIHYWEGNTVVLSDSDAEISIGVVEDVILAAPPGRLVDVRDIHDNEYHCVVYYGELG